MPLVGGVAYQGDQLVSIGWIKADVNCFAEKKLAEEEGGSSIVLIIVLVIVGIALIAGALYYLIVVRPRNSKVSFLQQVKAHEAGPETTPNVPETAQ